MTGHDPNDLAPAARRTPMTPDLLWLLPAAALFACGWYASARYHKRKLSAVHAQVKAIRQTAAEHANQARRQIGQLQAELASRPAAVLQRAAQPAPAAGAAPSAAAAAEARRAAAEKLVPDHGFAPTAIAQNNGFARTQVME